MTKRELRREEGQKELKRIREGFTLIELVVVLVVIGVLATIAVSHFGVMREQTLSREATAHLKIIQAAENTVRLEQGEFAGCVDTAACNEELGLDLPSGNWDYAVRVMVIGGDDFVARADRVTGGWSECIYAINAAMSITVNNGRCLYTETE